MLSLLPAQIVAIEATDVPFEPSEFVEWDPEWFHPRDWGKLS